MLRWYVFEQLASLFARTQPIFDEVPRSSTVGDQAFERLFIMMRLSILNQSSPAYSQRPAAGYVVVGRGLGGRPQFFVAVISNHGL